jgi:hypothetical protein
MTDEVSLAEFGIGIQQLTTTLDEAETALELNPPPQRSSVRRLILKLQKQIELVEKFKPARGKPDLYEYATKAVVLVYNAKTTLAELPALDQENTSQPSYERNSVTGQTKPIPKIDVNVPVFDGSFESYGDFIEAFKIATDHPALTKKQKFLFFREKLGQRPKNLIAHIPVEEENYEKVLKIINDKYNNRSQIVRSLYSKLQETPIASTETMSLRETYDNVEALLRALELHEEPVKTNVFVKTLVQSKFPQDIIFQLSPEKPPDLETIRTRLDALITMREEVANVTAKPTFQFPNITSALVAGTTPTHQTSASHQSSVPKQKTERQITCAFCKEAHYSDTCTKYTTAQMRKEALPENACFNCLNTGHSKKKCRYTKPCFYCKASKTHHTALCPKKFGYFEKIESVQVSEKGPKTKNESPKTVNLQMGEHGTYLTTKAKIRNPRNGQIEELRILLDTGSPASFITEEATKILGLDCSNMRNMPISVFASTQVHHLKTHQVHFEILSSSYKLEIFADTTPLVAKHVTAIDVKKFKEKNPQFEKMEFADPAADQPVSVLLGNDYLFHVLLPESKKQVSPGVFLINSIFGWLIVGKIRTKEHVPIPIMLATTEALNRLWNLDTIGIRDEYLKESEEEEMALKQFYKNVRNQENRYEVAIPWREYPPDIPANYGVARGRLVSLVRKHQDQPKYLLACKEIFNQQLQSGIIEEVPVDDLRSESHYIPFHFVIQESKSTPIRIVYDGSTKTKRQMKSINDCIYRGKNMLSQIPEILLRSRMQPILVIADFEKAYHMIDMREFDRDYFRFIWPEDPLQPTDQLKLKIYRFRRIPFGIVSSAFLLAATILYHLGQENQEKLADRFGDDLYVDNLITGVKTTAEAQELYNTAVACFRRAGMNLRNWASNNNEFAAYVPNYHRDYNIKIGILGLNWNTQSDSYTVTVPKMFDFDQPSTLRRVLKSISQFFDPLGFFAPVASTAKIFLQKLQKEEYEWDRPLPCELTKEWIEVYNNLREAQDYHIPRYIEPLDMESCEIHCFADSSQDAYATAVYLRTKNGENVNVSLIFAKARVAPIRKITIPKLELIAAVAGTRSLRFVIRALKLPPTTPKTLWVDSKCVLSWIHSTRLLPTFVSNRIKEIRAEKHVEHRYVPSALNIADLPSRGTTTKGLTEEKQWWNGPDFLYKTEDNWPPLWISTDGCENSIREPDTEDGEPENKPILITKTELPAPFHIQIERYSSFGKLLRVTAYCIAFLRNNKFAQQTGIFNNVEKSSLRMAKELWIRNEQKNHFGDVLHCIQRKKKHPLISKFRLYVDQEGIIRCRGRLQEAPIPIAERNPILLPRAKQSPFVHLLIMFVHVNNCHPGTNHTITAIRRQYWILRGRAEVYHTIQKCPACSKQTAKPYKQPEISNLPAFRLEAHGLPFKKVGIDVFGHFYIGSQKKWVLIVTCLVTRAVALEDLDDLTSNHIALAIRRIRARRTTADFYLSDNMAQFKLIKEVIQKSATEPFDWKFIKEHAPWEGAVYERLVAVAKTAIYRTFRHFGYLIGPLQFRTILVEIETAINDRPLTMVTEDLDMKPLTPNDFLRVHWTVGENEVQIPQTATEASRKLTEIWAKNKQIVDYFWSQWKTAYLQFLRERSATQQFTKKATQVIPQIGDVVIIETANINREKWKMGIVSEVIHSTDGAIRAAAVRQANGQIVVRPVQQLFPLELNNTGAQAEAPEDFEIDSISVEEISDDAGD